MSQQLTLVNPQKIKDLDAVAKKYLSVSGDESPFSNTFTLASAMVDLRELLTTDVMKPIMALMNTDLGFRTDRDPKNYDKDGKPLVPYSESVVKDVVIECVLRGFYTINNEMNIIAGRFYAAKNGLRRKVTTYPNVTDFKDLYDVPRTNQNGALIKCSATWKKNGIPDKIECEMAIRVNSFMGIDAIVGKAERKLLKRVLDRISGIITPDGEIEGEADLEGMRSANNPEVPSMPQKSKTETQSNDQNKETEATTPAPIPAPTTNVISDYEKLVVMCDENGIKISKVVDALKKLGKLPMRTTITTDKLTDQQLSWCIQPENFDKILANVEA